MTEPTPLKSDQSLSSKVILEGKDIKKRYRIGKKQIEVLHGVNLNIKHGEFLSIVGASGSGKSTLLHILGGLDLADTGD